MSAIPDPDGRWLAREAAWSVFVDEIATREGVAIDGEEDDIPPEVDSVMAFAEELVGRLDDIGLKLVWVDEGALILARQGRL